MIRALRVWWLGRRVRALADDVDHYAGVMEVGARRMTELAATIKDRRGPDLANRSV